MSDKPTDFAPDNMDDFDRKLTESKYMNVVMQEFALAHAEAISLVISALGRQVDLPRLSKDLRAAIEIGQKHQAFHPVALKMAASVYKTVEAQARVQTTDRARRDKGH